MSQSILGPELLVAPRLRNPSRNPNQAAATPRSAPGHTAWPPKHDLFGVQVSATDYAASEDIIIQAAHHRRGGTVTHLPVHGIVTAATQAAYRACINDFDIVAPDGQPVRWAMNRFNQSQLPDRVYGPELMLRLCRRAAREGISIYLYGSTSQVITLLKTNLQSQCPGLIIAGAESPPFRALSAAENDEVIARVNASGAGLLFIGLGCPRQDFFAHQNRGRIQAIQLCVGRCFRLSRGEQKNGPALDAAPGTGVAFPPHAGTATLVEKIPGHQHDLHVPGRQANDPRPLTGLLASENFYKGARVILPARQCR